MSFFSLTKCICSGKGTCSYYVKNARSLRTSGSSVKRTQDSTETPLVTNLQRDSASSQPSTTKKKDGKGSSKRFSSKLSSDADTTKPSKPENEDSSTKSTFKSEYDIQMAERQMSIRSLPPAEQKKQEEWAQTQLKQNASSNCPVGLIWVRCKDGYRCLGGAHYVSDELLAEGKGGWYHYSKYRGSCCKANYGPDPKLGNLSEKEKRKIRLSIFGKENPTAKNKLW